MRLMRSTVSILCYFAALLCAQLLCAQTKPAVEVPGVGLTGYLSVNVPTPPAGYGYGISFYAPAWPLLQSPIRGFTMGYPSTWILPNNSGYSGVDKLCPAGTLAHDQHWVPPGGSYAQYFEDIEPNMGYWWSTREPWGFPKYRISGTPDCYTTQISSPGWQLGTITPLNDNQMAIVQLSNRILVPPDGLPLQPGLNGQLLGTAWMALPLTPQQNVYFQLTSYFQAANNLCLNGNSAGASSPLGGNAYMAPCGGDAETWQTIRAPGGYFQLQSVAGQAGNLCLEGGTGAPQDPHSGFPYMNVCSLSPGQLWTLVGTGDWRHLQTQQSQALNLCLESSDGAHNSVMNPCGNFAGQSWEMNFQQQGTALEVGDRSWTLFFNTTNYKGPVAYWLPSAYANIGNGYPPDTRRTMDFQDIIIGSLAMEVNSMPMMYALDSTGTVNTSVPLMQFPINANGSTVLMRDLTMHGSGSLFDPTLSWFQGGAAPHGFNPSAAWIATGCTANPIRLSQETSAQDATLVPLTGIDAYVQTTLLQQNSCTWGLQWTGAQEMTEDGFAVLPRFFQQQGNQRTAILRADVPPETLLTTTTFEGPLPAATYTSPTSGTTSWSVPGPAAGPFRRELADGSTVTYFWYRFVDQPTLQRFPMTDAQKEQLQQRIELIQANWRPNQDYMARPRAVTWRLSTAPCLSGPRKTWRSATFRSLPAKAQRGHRSTFTEWSRAYLHRASSGIGKWTRAPCTYSLARKSNKRRGPWLWDRGWK